MRILLLSDLHLEFHRDGGASTFDLLPDADVVACAGDIGTGSEVGAFLGRLCNRYRRVLYVKGNHEHYVNWANVRDSLPVRGNFHYLEEEIIEIDGIRFLGTPLWYPYLDWVPYRKFVSDPSFIQDFEKTVFGGARAAAHFLYVHLDEGDVVVTHMMPSSVCISPRYRHSVLNGFFLHDQSELILDRKPRLWLYGHTHDAGDTVLGETRLYANPHGYPRENATWEPKVIEI